MRKTECMLELQRALLTLAEKIVNKNFPSDKYNNQKKEFAPFNKEFKDIVAETDSFYFDEESDSKLLNKIKELTSKIKLRIKSLEKENVTNSVNPYL